MIRVLVTGAGGQVGADVARAFGGRAEVLALDRAALDLERPEAIAAAVREARPQVIVNAGAYTAVDRAEAEPAVARAVNGRAPGVLAEAAKRSASLLVHYSTDYVFDGTKPAPYVETDPPAPLNVYGETKLEGERAIAESGCPHVILRTSWVYAPRGRNFLLTMLRLAETRDEIRVVDDQRGAPTSSAQLAAATLALFVPGGERRAISAEDVARVASKAGLYHASASGETTWFGFARAIFDGMHGRHPAFKAPRLAAITTAQYPTPARRPANSLLCNERLAAAFDIRFANWSAALDDALSALGR